MSDRVPAERAGHEAHGPARQGEIRRPRDRGYTEFDRHRRDERGRQRGTGEQPVERYRAKQDPGDDADPERRLGQRVQEPGRRRSRRSARLRRSAASSPDARNPARCHRSATGHHWPVSQPPIAIVDGQEHDHQHASGGEGILGQPGGQEHRREGGNRNERRQNRVAEVGQDDPGTLGQVRADQRPARAAASRMLSASGTACGVPSTGTAACHAWESPAMPNAMAKRFGGTRGPANLRRLGLWSFATI